MSVFFNGRLWTTPATMSLVDDSAMANKNLSVGNVLAVIGQSKGGKPFTALSFGSPQEARATLLDGELLRAVEAAFDPSSQTFGPQVVIAVRANPAVQSALALLDGAAAPVINLASTDYGLYTNNIKVKIENGTNTGKKLTTQVGNSYFSQDDIARNCLSVQYLGAEASATITTTNTSVVLSAPAGTPVSTIDLTSYETVGQLVDRINAVAGWTASVQDGNINAPALSGLDTVTAQACKASAYVVTGTLQAIVDWINGLGEGYVTATRVGGAGTLPVNLAWTYLAGGSDGTTIVGNWQTAFDELQSVDCQWVVPVTSNPALWAMADTHCSFMSNVSRKERRAFVGMASGSTDAQAIAAAKALNSDRTALVHLGYYDYDHSGKLVLYPPYILAALIGGAFSGVNPGTALTNKALKLRGIERNLRNPVDTDALITGGVLCVESTAQGYKVAQSVTTWLVNDNYNRVEVSVGAACDFVSRNVRNALDVLRGEKATPELLAQAVSRVDTALRELARPEPVGPGVITGDAKNPPFKNIQATIEGDVMRVEFQCSPVIPCNYIPIVIHAVPYSGTLSL